ncbi:MAG: SHOCT domain-containing protein [Actinomycetes bacterium]
MGLMRMAARTAVVAGTATAVSGRVAHKQAVKYDQQAQQQEAAAAAAAPPPAAAPAAPAVDPQMEQLQNLANLHNQGVLSDEEFAAAKAKALGI